MKLLRLHVENFGKLQNFTYSFDEGLNVLLEENGWGRACGRYSKTLKRTLSKSRGKKSAKQA